MPESEAGAATPGEEPAPALPSRILEPLSDQFAADVLDAQRRERARIRSERQQRGAATPKAA